MKCLYLLLLVVSPAYFRKVNQIPTPNLVRLTLVDPPGFIAEWTPVQNNDQENPILGYKVNVWEQNKVKQYHYETVNGVKVLVEEYVDPKFPNNDVIPEGKPKEIIVDGAEKTSVKVEPIKHDVTYEIRVQAYTKGGEGPLSLPMRIHILPSEKDHAEDLYTVA